MSESDSVRYLMQEAEATLGKTLSPAMTSLLLTITDDYGLPVEVTVMLLHYAKEVQKTGTAYIDPWPGTGRRAGSSPWRRRRGSSRS